MTTMDKRLSGEYQRNVSEFVHREVVYCVSYLISELCGNDQYMDELLPVMVQDDYVEPGQWFLDNEMADSDVVEWYTLNIDDEPDRMSIDDMKSKISEHLDDDDGWMTFCDDNRLEPYQREALEHWIVSDYLANRLEDAGEMIVRYFLGLTIWGRTTTGQAIMLDDVICNIYDNGPGKYKDE